MENVNKVAQKFKSGNEIEVPGAYITRDELFGMLSEIYDDIESKMINRMEALHRTGNYIQAVETHRTRNIFTSEMEYIIGAIECGYETK